MRRLASSVALCAAAACAGGSLPEQPPAGGAPSPQPVPSTRDTTGLVPAGYGSLRQDDVALHLEVDGVDVKLLPLDERVIRLLAPDSYRALRDLVTSRQVELGRLATVHGLRERNVWYVSFYGMTQEARFAPLDLTVSSPGREARPLAVLPLTSGFGEHRVRARETQSALVLLDDGIDVTQPLSVMMGAARSAAWSDILRVLERERALVRARARGS